MRYTIVCLVAVLTTTIGGCRDKAPAYHEKTQQERAAAYRRDLITDDLRLFGLQGSVSTATAQNLHLSFMPNGLLEAAVYNGDSLTIVRNNEGCILHLLNPQGDDALPELEQIHDLQANYFEHP